MTRDQLTPATLEAMQRTAWALLWQYGAPGAEDVVQEAFVAVLEKLDAIHDPISYMRGATKYLLYGYFRQISAARNLLPVELPFEDDGEISLSVERIHAPGDIQRTLELRQECARVQRTMRQRLSRRDCAVLALAGEGDGRHEIREKVGGSLHSVSVAMSRGRQRMKAAA